MHSTPAPFSFISPANRVDIHIPCQVQTKALRHKNATTSGSTDDDGTGTGGSTTVPDASPSGSTTVPDASPSGSTTVPDASPSGSTLVSMEYLRDEDDQVFVPRTHTKAVQNAQGTVLDDMLTDYEARIIALEQSIAPSLKIADNLLTDAASIALSARQGKSLNDYYKGILEHASGDVRSDGTKLLLQENSITEDHISPNAVTSDAIADGAITASHLSPASVLSDTVAEQQITISHLSPTLQQSIADIEDMSEWREQTSTRLTTLEQQMQAHITLDALLKEQNTFLLREHQKMKHLDVVASIYNATTDTTVQGSISVDDIRMSGLQVNYKWRFWDEIDSKDYAPTSFSIKAQIHSALLDDAGDPVLDADGNQSFEDSVLTLSTDKGLNNLDQVLRVRALNAGSTVKIISTVNYCWLDWTHTYNINITA